LIRAAVYGFRSCDLTLLGAILSAVNESIGEPITDDVVRLRDARTLA